MKEIKIEENSSEVVELREYFKGSFSVYNNSSNH